MWIMEKFAICCHNPLNPGGIVQDVFHSGPDLRFKPIAIDTTATEGSVNLGNLPARTETPIAPLPPRRVEARHGTATAATAEPSCQKEVLIFAPTLPQRCITL